MVIGIKTLIHPVAGIQVLDVIFSKMSSESSLLTSASRLSMISAFMSIGGGGGGT